MKSDIVISEAAREILGLRSIKDKFAIDERMFRRSSVARYVLELLDLELCVYLDTAILYGRLCVIFKLTPKGIEGHE